MRHALVTIACILLCTATKADERKGSDVVLHVGEYSVMRAREHQSTEVGIEYRFADQYYGLRPTVGILGNSDSAMYGYAGINWDLPLGFVPIIITPGTAIGAYKQGDSKDLGLGLEFRSSLEVTYRFNDGQRVGAAISHLSNADISDRNPGVETIQFVYSYPL
jgi:lipid A 3-O-deacylase